MRPIRSASRTAQTQFNQGSTEQSIQTPQRYSGRYTPVSLDWLRKMQSSSSGATAIGTAFLRVGRRVHRLAHSKKSVDNRRVPDNLGSVEWVTLRPQQR